MRRGKPDAEDIDKRTREKEASSGSQQKLDKQMISQYHQDHVIDAYQPKNMGNKKIVKPVGMGIVGTQIDRNVHVLRPRPSARVNAVGGQEAERHVSGTIEPWLNIAVWRSQGDFPVWDTGLLDQNLIGEFVSKVLPAPQFWADDEVADEVEKLNSLVAEGASEEEIKKQKAKLQRAKDDNWPIVWRYVDPTSTYDAWDERGRAEVFEVRKLTRETIESRFGAIDLPDDVKKETELEVVEYANHTHVASVLRRGGGIRKRDAVFLKEPWEHGLGMLPYTFIRFDPMRQNDRGHTRRGASYHGREMVQMVDESITDLRTVSRKEVETPLWARLIPRLRAALGLEEKSITIEEGVPVILLQGEEGSEEIGRVATPTVNPNLFALVQFGAEYLDRSGAHRPETIGQGPAGQSAVHLDTARQAQITELSVAHFNAQDGFANICKLHLRALPEDDKVTIREADGKHGSREISLTREDSEKYELLIQGVIKLALPVNRGAAVTNARLLTEARGPGQRPLLSDVAVLQGELDIENPMEMVDSVNEQLVVNALVDQYIETLKRQAQVAAGELTPEEIAAIAQGFDNLPQQAQQALLARFSGDVPQELGGGGQLARGEANTARATRGQQLSEVR
ncbi:hypothetical protein LCGC14_0779960 [marine sediment metagenome]|uniref:Portal protein n=1 Tax=marine sediment metagenome TaxID=412755 RepID=A0A0F9QFR2_9ZZZZ